MITITNRDCRGYLDDLRSPFAHDGIVCTEREDANKRNSICQPSCESRCAKVMVGLGVVVQVITQRSMYRNGSCANSPVCAVL